MDQELPHSVTLEVKDRCLCLHLQRAARAIARRFDDAFRPLGINQGQYSLLVSLNRPKPPNMRDVAWLLAMDRTTLTAILKPLERRGLLTITPDPKDKRSRLMRLTDEGKTLLKQAVPIWRATHDEVDKSLKADPDALRGDLLAIAFASA